MQNILFILNFLSKGWLGAFGSLAYGAYRYKTRGPSTKISVFVIQLRVLTQGAIVGSLFVGMLHHIYSQYNAKQNEVKK